MCRPGSRPGISSSGWLPASRVPVPHRYSHGHIIKISLKEAVGHRSCVCWDHELRDLLHPLCFVQDVEIDIELAPGDQTSTPKTKELSEKDIGNQLHMLTNRHDKFLDTLREVKVCAQLGSERLPTSVFFSIIISNFKTGFSTPVLVFSPVFLPIPVETVQCLAVVLRESGANI